MNTIETKLKELEKLNRYQTKYGDSVISKDIQQLIQALREAVYTLEELRASAMRRYGTEKEINKLTTPGRGEAALVMQALTRINKILNGGK